MSVLPNWKILAQAACVIAAIGMPAAYAQTPTALEQAELATSAPKCGRRSRQGPWAATR